MNAHAFISTPEPEIDILEVEDTINTALNAALMVHDFVEEMLGRIARPGQGETANTVSYALGIMREAVRSAHDHFHEYLQQDFARQRERAVAVGEPDPLICPSWKGAGIYRFHSLPKHEFLSVCWNAELGWFNLVIPITGERYMALCPELWQERVSGLVSNHDLIAEIMGEAA